MDPIIVDAETQETITYRNDVSSDCLGVHETCRGFVNMHKVSKDYNALNCRNCGLRKYFPATIDLTIFDRDEIWKRLSEWFRWKNNN